MADLFTVLAADQAEIKAILAELETRPTKAGGAD
jgi:hypothetical protein